MINLIFNYQDAYFKFRCYVVLSISGNGICDASWLGALDIEYITIYNEVQITSDTELCYKNIGDILFSGICL